MSAGNDRNVFDDLNNALFAQISKLQSIDPDNEERMEQCIEQSREVSHLAGNVIMNTRNAVNLARLRYEAGLDLGSESSDGTKLLKGRY